MDGEISWLPSISKLFKNVVDMVHRVNNDKLIQQKLNEFKSDRDTIITDEEITGLKILLETNSVDEFLEKMS